MQGGKDTHRQSMLVQLIFPSPSRHVLSRMMSLLARAALAPFAKVADLLVELSRSVSSLKIKSLAIKTLHAPNFARSRIILALRQSLSPIIISSPSSKSPSTISVNAPSSRPSRTGTGVDSPLRSTQRDVLSDLSSLTPNCEALRVRE